MDLSDLDIADAAATSNFGWSGLDLVINTAAYTAVDGAETPAGRVAAWRVNATGVANLARVARDHDLTLVHISSEYVFDGRAPGPVPEDAPFSPLSAYGASKAAGDVAAALSSSYYIVRTTWMFGDGPNFVRTMLDLAARGVTPTVVADQIGRPTSADDLASGIIALTTSGQASGTYNISNTGDPASWADVARATFELAGRSPGDVADITTAAYFGGRPELAHRPLTAFSTSARPPTPGCICRRGETAWPSTSRRSARCDEEIILVGAEAPTCLAHASDLQAAATDLRQPMAYHRLWSWRSSGLASVPAQISGSKVPTARNSTR